MVEVLGGKQELVGIGGWLILPAIGLVLRLMAMPIGLIAIAGLVRMRSEYVAYSAPAILVYAGLYVYHWVAAIRFFKKRAAAPQTMISLLIARFFASLVLFLLGLAVVGHVRGDHTLEVVRLLLRTNNFVANGIAAAIWIPYWKVSKRVKATFVD